MEGSPAVQVAKLILELSERTSVLVKMMCMKMMVGRQGRGTERMRLSGS